MTTRATLLTICCLLVSVSAGGIVAARTPVQGQATSPAGAQATGTGSVRAASGGSGCSFRISKTDATGETVTVESRPKRIVVLQPSDAQTVWEIGAQDRVVGMPKTQYTAYLDNRSEKTNVKNDDGSVNVELVVGLRPDVVIASNTTSRETVRKLRQAGLTVYHFGLVTSLDQIAHNVETVGALVGSCDAATQRANQFRLDVRTVERAAELADEKPTVLYYFFGYTAGTNTHLNDMIQTAGAKNIAAEVGIDSYAEISPEVAVDQNPDWIVYPSHASPPKSAAYNETTAMQRDQVIELDANRANQPGPLVAIPLIHLAKQWHPDALAQANESVTMANVTTANGSQDGRQNGTGTTQSSSSGPGFGIGLATIAIGAAALLAGRSGE